MSDEVLSPGVELLESMRSVGYSFDDAVADLIDNSITAQASSIEIVGDPVDGAFVSILDDGVGMLPHEARDALRLAGTGDKDRTDEDLGRFGLGLKTASLSQGRRLTLCTVRDGQTTVIQWDLDYVREVNDWRIRVLDDTAMTHIPAYAKFKQQPSGTLIVWETLDVLIGETTDPAAAMADLLADLRSHLGLVFHQFLDPKHVGGLAIRVNGSEVAPIDPFLASNPRTQRSQVERFTIGGATVEMQAFTLPHSSALSEAELRRPDLSIAMQAGQGFYVYRSHRLIDWGKWYGITRRAELTKNTRIKVDFPNTLDNHWQLDIRKSKVRPPREFLDYYRTAILKETTKSERIHRYRGRKKSRADDFIALWDRIDDRNTVRYEINTAHPLVQNLVDETPEPQRTQLRQLLRDIADNMPAENAYVELADNKVLADTTLNRPDMTARLRALAEGGFLPADPTDATRYLKNLEPFAQYPDLDRLVKKVIGG